MFYAEFGELRLPRFCRPRSLSVNDGRLDFQLLTGELIECQALADDAFDGQIEPLRISQPPMVIPVRLLVQVSEQMKWFD